MVVGAVGLNQTQHVVECSITADGVVGVIEAAVVAHGAPSTFTSTTARNSLAKRVRTWVAEMGFSTLFIELGSLRKKAYAEGFSSKLRDKHHNLEECGIPAA